MVSKTACTAALVLALAGPSMAQTIDWSRAGGGLFGGPGPGAPTPTTFAIPVVAAQLPALDQPYADAVARAAERHGLDPKLLHALVLVESGYRPQAVSPAGAAGLTQLMTGTAADLGVRDRFDVEQNLSGGADYLAQQLVRFGDLRLALAAYNSGPDRVARLGRVPDIAETRQYVTRVLECFLALTAGRSVRTLRHCAPLEAVP
ncbi:MAG: lytic transglycosylase domain-containing protein [Brevundimonas sp.]|nr:lytic transglycosylase domain-containing protein [Brevundimonas sp.]